MTAIDPEFSAAVPPKKATRVRSGRVVRSLILFHALAALLTASGDFAYVACYHGWLDWDRMHDFESDAILLLALPTPLLFPLAINFTALIEKGRSDASTCRAVLASLALSAFQVFALLPAVQ